MAAVDIFKFIGQFRSNAVRKHERGTARRIHLFAMVAFDDLNVKRRTKGRGSAPDERHLKVYAERHVAGLEDRRELCGTLYLPQQPVGQAGGADNERDLARTNIL